MGQKTNNRQNLLVVFGIAALVIVVVVVAILSIKRQPQTESVTTYSSSLEARKSFRNLISWLVSGADSTVSEEKAISSPSVPEDIYEWSLASQTDDSYFEKIKTSYRDFLQIALNTKSDDLNIDNLRQETSGYDELLDAAIDCLFFTDNRIAATNAYLSGDTSVADQFIAARQSTKQDSLAERYRQVLVDYYQSQRQIYNVISEAGCIDTNLQEVNDRCVDRLAVRDSAFVDLIEADSEKNNLVDAYADIVLTELPERTDAIKKIVWSNML